jgi:hypothetical protein
VVLPLLSQTGLFWQVLLARFMLGKHLGSTQVGGVLLVVAGVVMAAWPAKGAGSVLANVSGSGPHPFSFPFSAVGGHGPVIMLLPASLHPTRPTLKFIDP